MTFPDLFERFSQTFFPLGTADEIKQRFQAIARYASARPGDAPFRGNGGDQIAFIVSGSTKLVAHASQGREQIVAFHFDDDLVSVPATAAHSYSLFALQNCELVFFPADRFMDLARQEPGMVAGVLDRALIALARCREKTIILGRKTAQEKLASFLLAMADRIGTRSDQRVELDLPMSRSDIGDSLGLTIETVSRQFSELRAKGLIETPSRSRISLLDMPALKANAGHLEIAA